MDKPLFNGFPHLICEWEAIFTTKTWTTDRELITCLYKEYTGMPPSCCEVSVGIYPILLNSFLWEMFVSVANISWLNYQYNQLSKKTPPKQLLFTDGFLYTAM